MVLISSTGDDDLQMIEDEFWAAIEKADIDLSKMNYSVCPLGNSMYFNFCGARKKIDKRFSELSATCVVNRYECYDGVMVGIYGLRKQKELLVTSI